MSKLNKKAAENTAISSTAKSVSVEPETPSLSDKYEQLYIFFDKLADKLIAYREGKNNETD